MENLKGSGEVLFNIPPMIGVWVFSETTQCARRCVDIFFSWFIFFTFQIWGRKCGTFLLFQRMLHVRIAKCPQTL